MSFDKYMYIYFYAYTYKWVTEYANVAHQQILLNNFQNSCIVNNLHSYQHFFCFLFLLISNQKYKQISQIIAPRGAFEGWKRIEERIKGEELLLFSVQRFSFNKWRNEVSGVIQRRQFGVFWERMFGKRKVKFLTSFVSGGIFEDNMVLFKTKFLSWSSHTTYPGKCGKVNKLYS